MNLSTNASSDLRNNDSSTAQIPAVTDLTQTLLDPVSGLSLSHCRIATATEVLQDQRFAGRLVELNERPQEEELEADPAARLQRVLQRVTTMDYLARNWDSYEGEPPSEEAKSKARNLIWEVVSQHFGTVGMAAIPFAVVPLSGAGVQIEWRGTDSIEVEVNAGGDLAYLLSRGQQADRHLEERDNASEYEVVRLVAAAVS